MLYQQGDDAGLGQAEKEVVKGLNHNGGNGKKQELKGNLLGLRAIKIDDCLFHYGQTVEWQKHLIGKKYFNAYFYGARNYAQKEVYAVK